MLTLANHDSLLFGLLMGQCARRGRLWLTETRGGGLALIAFLTAYLFREI